MFSLQRKVFGCCSTVVKLTLVFLCCDLGKHVSGDVFELCCSSCFPWSSHCVSVCLCLGEGGRDASENMRFSWNINNRKSSIIFVCCRVIPCSLQLFAPLLHSCTLWVFFILPDGCCVECAAGHFSDLAAGLIVRPVKSCACRHHCMPGLLKARPARRGCLYQTAFCLAFVVWVLVCSSSLGQHSQTSPPPPPPASSRSVLVLLQSQNPRERCPCPSHRGAHAHPCATWDKALHVVAQNSKPGQGAALSPTREVWLSLFCFVFFSWVFKVFHHLPGNSWVSVVWMSDSWIPVNDLCILLVPAERE